MNFETYFLNIATNLKSILHTTQKPKFARLKTPDEVQNLHRNNLDFSTPVMLLYLPTATLSDPLADNVHLHQDINLHVVQKIQSNDYQQIRDIQYACLLILFQILSKIQKDHAELVLHGFDRNLVSFERVEMFPNPDNVGHKMELTLHQSINPLIHYKPNDWL